MIPTDVRRRLVVTNPLAPKWSNGNWSLCRVCELVLHRIHLQPAFPKSSGTNQDHFL
jgi:hypothetical protein